MNINEVLDKIGQNEAAVVREHVILVGLSKVSRYEAECAGFKKKYGENLNSFQTRIEKQKHTEDFSQEDDLMDWQYADAALKWWRSQIEEL